MALTKITGKIGDSSTNITGSSISGASLYGTVGTVAQNSITSATSLASVGTIGTGIWNSTFGSTANTLISGSANAANISGSLGTNAILIRSLTAANISGSFEGGGSTKISGSSTSTGSFGKLLGDGSSLTGITTDISALETNIAMLGFYRAADNSKAVYNLQDQVIDEFVSSGGVDSANSSDQTLRDGHYSGFGVGSASDTYTKLLINGNSLEDSSDSRHGVTANGNPTINGSTYKFGSGSMHFDGTGDYLTIHHHADWNFGDNDFTIEFWMNTDVISADGSIGLITKGWSGENHAWGVYRVTDTIKLYASNSAGNGWEFTEEMVTGLSAGTWYHIAIVRNGDNYTGYKDGVADQTFTNSHTLIETSLGVSIGSQYTGYDFEGYLDEIRISKGVARWTSDFTPPTSAYSSYDSYTKLMLHFPGDKSTSSHNMAFSGSGITSFMPKFDHSSAMYFDGSGDYLEVADSDDWDWENDFTVDYWFKPLSWDSTTDGVTTFSQASSATKGFWTRHRAIPKVTWDAQDGGSTLDLDVNIDADDGPKVGEWAHWAWIRSGDEWYVYINGTRANQAYPAGTTDNNPGSAITAPLRIGKSPYRFDDALHGYIDEFRVSNSVRWATTFTPPTSEYDNPDSNTKLLIRSDTTDGSTTFTDSSPEGHTVTRGGGTKHFAPKFGGSAMYFDGSSDAWLTLGDHADWDWGTGDFTVDCWIYFTGDSTNYNNTVNLISRQDVSENPDQSNWFLRLTAPASSGVRWDIWRGDRDYTADIANNTVENTWVHFVWLRDGSDMRVYHNGTQIGSDYTTIGDATYSFTGNDLYIGSRMWDGDHDHNQHW